MGETSQMTTDFITIKEAKEAYKGSFIGTVIKVSEPKSGNKNGRNWTMKIFTIQDETDSIDITCFGDEVNLFKMGNKYEIIPWWKPRYEGNPNLGIGKYGSVNLIGGEIDLSNAPMTETGTPKETRGQLNTPSLPEIFTNFRTFIVDENIILAQISEVVRNEMESQRPTQQVNGQELGLRVKEIYRESKKSKFEKASEK